MKKMRLLPSAVLAANLLLCAVLSSCNTDVEKEKGSADVASVQSWGWSANVKIITVDSCQYVVAETGTSNGGISIIHKQNCTFCHNRAVSK